MAITAKEEREFEKQHILKQEKKYLNTDSIWKYNNDNGYKAKIELIKSFLNETENVNQIILDIGANTAGEAEVLVSQGFDMVATDINEIALSISKERCSKFGRKSPKYFAVDSHNLPFDDSTFDTIIAFEVLHHFEKLDIVMGELNRVLKPNGRMFAFEPYALNPYRRLAELRFLILGSIERSFTVNGLKRKFTSNGFNVGNYYKHILPPSEWKKKNSSVFRSFLKELYYRVRKLAPFLFGDLVFIATKKTKNINDGETTETKKQIQLICPITKVKLEKTEGGYLSQGNDKYFYKNYKDIPVLISNDAIKY